MEEYFSETASAVRLRVAVRGVLEKSQVPPELLDQLRRELAAVWKTELLRLDASDPRSAVVIKNKDRAQKEEWAIMKLVAEILGPKGMIEGGAIWRICIRGKGEPGKENFHPPRPARVLRTFYAVREALKEGVQIKTTISAYAWSIYKTFAD